MAVFGVADPSADVVSDLDFVVDASFLRDTALVFETDFLTEVDPSPEEDVVFGAAFVSRFEVADDFFDVDFFVDGVDDRTAASSSRASATESSALLSVFSAFFTAWRCAVAVVCFLATNDSLVRNVSQP